MLTNKRIVYNLMKRRRLVPPGRFAVTVAPLPNIPPGSQVIILKPLDQCKNPLVQVEWRGKSACAHLSDLRLLRAAVEVPK